MHIKVHKGIFAFVARRNVAEKAGLGNADGGGPPVDVKAMHAKIGQLTLKNLFIRRARQGRIAERKEMIGRDRALPVKRQAEVLGLARSSVYYQPWPVSTEDLGVMRRIDQLHQDFPLAGSRMLRRRPEIRPLPRHHTDAPHGHRGAVPPGRWVQPKGFVVVVVYHPEHGFPPGGGRGSPGHARQAGHRQHRPRRSRFTSGEFVGLLRPSLLRRKRRDLDGYFTLAGQPCY